MNLGPYQLAFTTPGISPFDASSLKHILQSLNLRIKPLLRPQRAHLLYFLTLNFGSFACFSISAFFAIASYLYFLNGIPIMLESKATLPETETAKG